MRASGIVLAALAAAFAWVVHPSTPLASSDAEQGALGIEYRSLEWGDLIPAFSKYRKFEILGARSGSPLRGVLHGGDVILQLDGKYFMSSDEFHKYVSGSGAGAEIVIAYNRPSARTIDERLGTVRVKLASPSRVADPIRTPCDALAAHPKDNDRVAEGVEWEQLHGFRARAACEDALRSYRHPRLFYQYGRALSKFGEPAAALAQLRHAVRMGHVEASFEIASIWKERPGLVSDCELRQMTDLQLAGGANEARSHINRAAVLMNGYCGPQNAFEARQHATLALRHAASGKEIAAAQELMRLINVHFGLRILEGVSGGESASRRPDSHPNDSVMETPGYQSTVPPANRWAPAR